VVLLDRPNRSSDKQNDNYFALNRVRADDQASLRLTLRFGLGL